MKKIYILFAAIFICAFFFASCKKGEYVVTFYPNGGEGKLITQSFTEKKAQSLIENSFVYSGYTFKGWNTTPEGTGIAYKDQEKVKISENKVLYAQWISESGDLMVTFNANGGVGKMLPQQFEAGTPQSLSPNAFLYEMYRFTDWNTSADGKGKKFTNQQIIIINSVIILYAQWEPLFKTVTFYANGGIGTMEVQRFLEFEVKELIANEFTRIGYVFTGWNTKADGSGGFYRNKQKTSLYSNMALYAQWVKNPEPCHGTPTVNDIDGNIYNTVQIGSQCWMKENLKTTKYKTGLNIPITSQWDTEGAMCYYDNDVSNAVIYGALYNQYAVFTENLCPEGWRIPDDEEWELLANYLGGENIAGFKMKSDYGWKDDWFSGDGNGSNQSGFTAFPAGARFSWNSYGFFYKGEEAHFWSSTNDGIYIITKRLINGSDKLFFDWGIHNSAFSVRCIKD